jgi:hypothetical protein
MIEHRIALRRAWKIHYLNQPAVVASRVDLPMHFDPARGPFKLDRAFHFPHRDDPSTPVRLCLERVPGLFRVLWDGTDVAGLDFEGKQLDVFIEAASGQRVGLSLHVDPTRLVNRLDPDSWGHIGIIIGRRVERNAG